MWLCVFLLCFYVNCNFADDNNKVEIRFDVSYKRGFNCQSKTKNETIKIAKHDQFQVYINVPRMFFGRCTKGLLPNGQELASNFHKEKIRPGYKSTFNYQVGDLGRTQLDCTIFLMNCTNNVETERFCEYKVGEENHNGQYSKKVDSGLHCTQAYEVVTKEEMDSLITVPKLHLNINTEIFQTHKNETFTYKFYDGEPLDVTCYKRAGRHIGLSYGKGKYVVISYSEHQFLTGFLPIDSVQFYVNLRKSDSYRTRITCSVYDENMKLLAQAMAIFVLKDSVAAEEDIRLSVNGLILPRTKYDEKFDYFFSYKYFDDEVMDIRIENKHEDYGEGTCYFGGTKLDMSTRGYGTITIPRNYKVNPLTCTIRNLKHVNSDVHLSLDFKRSVPDYSKGPAVGNFSMSNVLMKYANDTSNMIWYYIGDEKLYLTCYPNGSWRILQNQVQLESSKDRTKTWFRLKPNQASAVIVCSSFIKYNSGNTFITLVRKKEYEITPVENPPLPIIPPGEKQIKRHYPAIEWFLNFFKRKEPKQNVTFSVVKPGTKTTPAVYISTQIPEVTPLSDPSGPGVSTEPDVVTPDYSGQTNQGTTTKATDTSPLKPTDGDDENTWKIIVGVVTILIIISAVCGFVYFLRKTRIKKRRQNLDPSTIDYQNLPYHNEGPMPIPSQWDSTQDPTYASTTNVDHLYAKPLPKTLRQRQNQNSQDMYTNIEPNYASVNQATYAEVSKYQNNINFGTILGPNGIETETHQEITQPAYAEVSCYENLGRKSAQLTCKSKGGSITGNGMSKMDHTNHATIKEAPDYSNTGALTAKNKYKLRTDYENVPNKEYAEPAYCEINKK